MGETSSCNSCAVAAPGGGPGSTAAAGAGTAGAAVVATLGCAADDGAAAGWSSPREQPVTIGDVEIKTAAASINGIDRPFGLASNFIVDKPRRQL